MRTTTCTCDHCKKKIELDKPGWASVEIVVHPEGRKRVMDLCPECAANLLVDFFCVGSS
jgi:hypothetical protein